MTYEQMVADVRDSLGLPDEEHAGRALRATVAVLGERLSGQVPAHLAAQLPEELEQQLPEVGRGEAFDADEFVRRVGEKEGMSCSQDQLREHARASLAVLFRPSAAGDVRDSVVAQLPQDIRALLETR